MTEYLLLAVAAFLAGMLNTVAGGGTFLTFPALVYAGVPLVAANATSAVAVFPGYLGGAAGFRGEIRAFDRGRLLKATAATAAGALVGSLLLLLSSNEAFAVVVPFLLALATLVFAFADRLRNLMEKHATRSGATATIGTIAVAVYGGYFQGGLGIMLLALFSLWGLRDLNQMNGLKNGLSIIVSAISVASFAATGLVAWPQATVMMAAATIGGYLGAPAAKAVPAWMLRAGVISVGAAMSAVFFWRLLA
jgi:uncharacterized protein